MAMKIVSMSTFQSFSIYNIYIHERLLIKNKNCASLNIKKGANYI